jgi:hypothetical protein
MYNALCVKRFHLSISLDPSVRIDEAGFDRKSGSRGQRASYI